MNEKQAIMIATNMIIGCLHFCNDDNFVDEVLEHIQDAIEFSEDEIREVEGDDW